MAARVHTNGVPHSHVDRVQLSKAWLEKAKNSVVGTDQNGAEYFGEVTANFQAQIALFIAGGVGLRVVRDVGGLAQYYKKLSEKFHTMCSSRMYVDAANMTGNPSEKDMELGMIAKFERRDAYESIRLRRCEPSPLIHNAEQEAIHWLESWRILKASDKDSGAAAIAIFRAHAGRRAADKGVAVDVAGNTASSGVTNTAESEHDADAPSPESGKRQRPVAFREPLMGTQSILAKNAMDAAIRKDIRVSTEAMAVFSRTIKDRDLMAGQSAPAIRDVPRFRDFITRRADEMISA